MSAACSCQKRRWSKLAGSALPGVAAVLLPKCPLCIAAWVAASTGVAVPAIVASSLRPVLIAACVLVGVTLLIRRVVDQSSVGIWSK